MASRNIIFQYRDKPNLSLTIPDGSIVSSGPLILASEANTIFFNGLSSRLVKQTIMPAVIANYNIQLFLAKIIVGKGLDAKTATTFTFTGIAATAKASRLIIAPTQTFAVSTSDTILRYVAGKILTAALSTYALTGVAVFPKAQRKIPVTAYNISRVAFNTNLIYLANKKFAAVQATYNLTGLTTNLKAGKKVAAVVSPYTLTGITTTLTVTTLGYNPSLSFDDGRNSQYIAAGF